MCECEEQRQTHSPHLLSPRSPPCHSRQGLSNSEDETPVGSFVLILKHSVKLKDCSLAHTLLTWEKRTTRSWNGKRVSGRQAVSLFNTLYNIDEK